MLAVALYARTAIGATSSKPTMRYVFVIDVTVTCVGIVKKWISVMIVGRWYVVDVVRC